jgi:hypothetical protein
MDVMMQIFRSVGGSGNDPSASYTSFEEITEYTSSKGDPWRERLSLNETTITVQYD